MRWKAKPPPVFGDLRIVTHFAWSPVTICGVVVWLERYQVTQVYLPYRWKDDSKELL